MSQSLNMSLKPQVKAKPYLDQYQLVQGRRFALDLVESFGPQLLTPKGISDAIQRLTTLQPNKPKGFALGIQNVVDVLVIAQTDLPVLSEQRSADENE
ncbi:hypothetical protein [Pseudomonas sp. NPDC089734]|uniref:hypothetical protein n=1 Tax=Pseudomonas sp. NPDC089734 TaxID=3364469 RepID=UPI00381E19F9